MFMIWYFHHIRNIIMFHLSTVGGYYNFWFLMLDVNWMSLYHLRKKILLSISSWFLFDISEIHWALYNISIYIDIHQSLPNLNTYLAVFWSPHSVKYLNLHPSFYVNNRIQPLVMQALYLIHFLCMEIWIYL